MWTLTNVLLMAICVLFIFLLTVLIEIYYILKRVHQEDMMDIRIKLYYLMRQQPDLFYTEGTQDDFEN